MIQSPCWHTATCLARLGIRVFPIVYGGKEPLLPTDWRVCATNNLDEMTRLFPTNKPYNLAITVGPQSGIIDLEIDNPAGETALKGLYDFYGSAHTVTYQSKRGLHRWFRWDADLAEYGITNFVWHEIGVRLGLEFSGTSKTSGAYSLVPPSLHPDGMYYQWLPGCAPWETPIPPLPEGIKQTFIQYLRDHRSSSKKSMQVGRIGDDFLPEEGQRHSYMLRISHMLAGPLRLPRQLVVDMIRPLSQYTGAYDSRRNERLAERELCDMVESVERVEVAEEAFASINFVEAYELARQAVMDTKADAAEARRHAPLEIPSNIFNPRLEEISWCAHKAQLPRNFFLMSTFGAYAAAIGASVTVQASPDYQPMGIQNYQLGVGSSGSGKSRVLNRMLSPFSEAAGFATDATTESLRSEINRNPRGVLLKVVEGKQFTKMLGRYTGVPTENSILLEAWSGDTIAVSRQDDKKSFRIESPYLTVIAAIQPHNLNSMSVEDVMEGIMQRLMIYEGDKVPKDADSASQKAFNKWFEDEYTPTLKRLMELRPFVFNDNLKPMEGEQDRTTLPLKLILDHQAEQVWRKYASWKKSDEVLGQYPDDHPFQNDLVRHAEQVLRTAANIFLHDLASDPEQWSNWTPQYLHAMWIPDHVVQRAIDLVEWTWGQKLNLMTNIVEQRFREAMPPNTLSERESLPQAVQNFAVRRCRILNTRLKGNAEWSLREYYRSLRLSSDQANHEVRLLLSEGFVEVSGVRNLTTLYRFTQRIRNLCGLDRSQDASSIPESQAESS